MAQAVAMLTAPNVSTTYRLYAQEEGKNITLTGVDLAKIPDLLGTLDGLARALVKIDQKPVVASRRYAQAFEICEYGRRPTAEQIKQMFPF